MATIEAHLQAGLTLTATIRDPENSYSSLASAIAVTVLAPGVYVADVGNRTGIKKIELLSGLTVFAFGFVNLDLPGENGRCEVLDTIEDAKNIGNTTPIFNVLPGRDRGQSESDRSEIVVKLEEQTTIVRSVVDANGNPVNLSGRELEFVIEDARGADVAVISHADIDVSGTDHNVYSFEIPTAATAKLGTYMYSLNDLTGKSELAGGDWIVKRRALNNP